jgi:hypothetical protein
MFVWIEGANDWKMIYEAESSSIGGGAWYLGYATSTDQGKTWTKYSGNPIQSGSGPEVHKIGNGYYLWYHDAVSGVLPTDIYMAHSTSLPNFTKDGKIMSRNYDWEGYGNSGGQIADPSMLEINGSVYMWYDAIVQQSSPPNQTIALAIAPYTFEQLANKSTVALTVKNTTIE